jgi:peptidoglycan/xylan/chitin deacetylase (PgdA/CDA1 family)
MEPIGTGSVLKLKERIKPAARRITAWACYYSRPFLTRLKGKVLILAYHRVLPEEALQAGPPVQPGMYVCANTFGLQMRFLREHFEVLSFAELLARLGDKDWAEDKRYCVVTFDDGWRDNFLFAFPLLRQYRIPATIFVPTALIGSAQWFWPDKVGYLLRRCFLKSTSSERANSLSFLKDRYPWLVPQGGEDNYGDFDAVIERAKSRRADEIESLLDDASRVLGIEYPNERLLVQWNEVEEMSKHGISFGSHSCTHRIFTTLSIEEVQKEVSDSMYALRSKPINYVPVLAYPNGNYNEEIIAEVSAAGYQAAVSTQFGFEGPSSTDLFKLKRIGVHQDISATLPLFSFHVAGRNKFMASIL